MRSTKTSFDVPPLEQKATQVVLPTKNKFSVFKGFILALLSGVLFSLCGLLVKQMKNLHPGQLVVYRFVAIFAISLPEAVKCGKDLFGPKNLRIFLVLNSIFAATNIFLSYVAFRYLPLGEAGVIVLSNPVFVTAAARIFLKEPCGMFQTFTLILTVIGIIFTARIPSYLSKKPTVYTTEFIYGIVAAVASLFFSTTRFFILLKVKSVHHAIILFNFGCVAILEAVLLTALIGNFKWQECGLQGLYIILLGFLSYAGQTLLTLAVQCELVGPVSTIRAAGDIVFAFIWQTVLFHDIPDIFSIVGAVLVGFSVVFCGLNKWVSSLSEDSSKFKYLKWMIM